MLGELLSRQRDSSAIGYYERAWNIYPGNQKVGYALGNLYIQAEMPDSAIPLCQVILESDSTNTRFRKLLGFAHYKAGNPQLAIQHFNKALAQGDSTAFTFKFKGISHYLAIEFHEAIHSLQAGAARDSLDAEIQFFLGVSLATTTMKTEALYHLDRSLRLMEPDPSVKARIYSEQGNIKRLEMEYEEAYAFYNKAWEADSTDPMALYYMASILDNSLHRRREALVDYQRFLDAADRLPGSLEKSPQGISIRGIVEDRIVMLKEELFFLDQDR
jgi:tetratricopeptide (TPR) repeat protein